MTRRRGLGVLPIACLAVVTLATLSACSTTDDSEGEARGLSTGLTRLESCVTNNASRVVSLGFNGMAPSPLRPGERTCGAFEMSASGLTTVDLDGDGAAPVMVELPHVSTPGMPMDVVVTSGDGRQSNLMLLNDEPVPAPNVPGLTVSRKTGTGSQLDASVVLGTEF